MTNAAVTSAMTDWLAQATETIRAANAQARSLEITGSGSKAFYGHAVRADQQLSTLGYAGFLLAAGLALSHRGLRSNRACGRGPLWNTYRRP